MDSLCFLNTICKYNPGMTANSNDPVEYLFSL